MAINKFNDDTYEMITTTLGSDEFTVIDIETTELYPDKGGRIIEVGAVRLVGGVIVDTFSQLVNPEQKIYKKTTEITGITNEMIKDMPVYRKVLPELYKFIGNTVVVCHNAIFDWDRFLLYFFPKVGIFPHNKVVDTLKLSKHLFRDEKKHNLDIVCKRLGIEFEKHHRAIDDALATAKAFVEIKKILAKENSLNPIPQYTQLDLFLIAGGKESEAKQQDSKPQQGYKIKYISCWPKKEAQTTKKLKSYKRIYVNLNIGTAYFDVNTKTWGNKDIQQEINFDSLQEKVLKYLKLNSVEELCDYCG